MMMNDATLAQGGGVHPISNKFSAQIERFEVVETGRRRRWTDDEKLKIVLESLQAPRAVSSTARRYGISHSLLLTWRRSFGTRTSDTEQPQPAFVPAMVVPDQPPRWPLARERGHLRGLGRSHFGGEFVLSR
ncbi:transposase [Bradyrhizobium sp. WSM1743]|uniref:IS66-like element accessory protein TnpA n=1 Tax=Bradyrhizobium sp. WSM1743 TaxID=318996 RepID=UPI001FD9B4DE|nr:transposase [Bradyrhizobium sp. WSM1743]